MVDDADLESLVNHNGNGIISCILDKLDKNLFNEFLKNVLLSNDSNKDLFFFIVRTYCEHPLK